MAKREDLAVEVFTALHMGTRKSTDVEVAEAREAIRELASNPNPQNKYAIGQLMAFVVNNIINQSTDYLNLIAEVKPVSLGEKAMFKKKLQGVEAFLIAKNGTPQKSRVMNGYQLVDTQEVAAYPEVNLDELASGKVNFDEMIADASFQMEYKMIQAVEATLYAAFTAYSTPNYATGAGVVAATIDPQIRAFQRLGKVSLLGDVGVISKFVDLTGLTAGSGLTQFSPEIINEYNANSYLGNYKGANVIAMNNPFVDGSLSDTYLKKDLVYILPAGAEKPLKVVLEGDVTATEETHATDNTMGVVLRKKFGSAIVAGNNVYMGIYEDSSI